MADRAPETIGELGLILLRVEQSVKDLRQETVARSTFEAEQRRTREELASVREQMTSWVAESKGAHVDLAKRIDENEEKQVRLSEESRKQRSARALALASMGVSVALGFAIALLNFALGRV